VTIDDVSLPAAAAGYNKRLRHLAATMAWLSGQLGGRVSVADDDVWVADSAPVECGRSRETAKRSDLAGWAEYGYCASHSRYFWGLRLHLVATLHGLPLGWALTGAKADERATFCDLLNSTPALSKTREATQTLIADKGYYGTGFETDLTAAGITRLRPSRKGEKPCNGERFFKPLRHRQGASERAEPDAALLGLTDVDVAQGRHGDDERASLVVCQREVAAVLERCGDDLGHLVDSLLRLERNLACDVLHADPDLHDVWPSVDEPALRHTRRCVLVRQP
jgi:hypothetical protein